MRHGVTGQCEMLRTQLYHFETLWGPILLCHVIITRNANSSGFGPQIELQSPHVSVEEDIASSKTGQSGPHSRHFAVGSKNLNAYHFFLFRLYLDLAESESGRVQGMPKEQTQAPQTATIEAPVHGDHSQTCPRTHGE